MKQTGSAIKAALAERETLSAPCWQRLKRPERGGLIRGYHAELVLETVAAFTTGARLRHGQLQEIGLGREGPRLGLEAFMEVKYVCIDAA